MNPTTGTTRDSDAVGVLASIRQARAEANAAEARVLASALEWAHLHVVEDPDDACTLVKRPRFSAAPKRVAALG